ncbi:MAG: DUF3836 domain-containing protein [Dysgonomonas sp.]
MKAIVVASVLAALVFSASISAKNVKTYINMESNGSGIKKEYVSLDVETHKPLTREYYNYDSDGNITIKTVSKWNDKLGWVNYNKYEYNYLENGKIANISYTEWNGKKNMWADKSDLLIHFYNDNGEFLSIRQIEIENSINDYNLISQK